MPTVAVPELRVANLGDLPRSETPQQTIVVGMRADPEPDDNVSVEHGERTIAEADTGRIDRAGGVDLFEPQTGMLRIVAEEPLGRARAAPDVVGQLSERVAEVLGRPRRQRSSGSRALVRPARCSSSALSARRAKASWD
jgi:hypothetical protein